MGNSHKNLLLRNHWANCNQTLVEWSLGGPLPNLCPVIPTPTKKSVKLKIEKGWWNLKKIFSSETTEPISTKLCWNDQVVPFQNSVCQCRPVSKMVAITKNRNFFKWPKLLYLSQNVPKFEMYKHNDEVFNIYYRIFYELLLILTDYAN